MPAFNTTDVRTIAIDLHNTTLGSATKDIEMIVQRAADEFIQDGFFIIDIQMMPITLSHTQSGRDSQGDCEYGRTDKGIIVLFKLQK